MEYMLNNECQQEHVLPTIIFKCQNIYFQFNKESWNIFDILLKISYYLYWKFHNFLVKSRIIS